MLEDLKLRVNRPTDPYDKENLTLRTGRITEALKDIIVWELRTYFSHQTPDRVSLVPFVEKFSARTDSDREFDPLETVVRITRQYPDVTEKLPYLGVTVSTHKNEKLGFSTKYVGAVLPRPRLVAGSGPAIPGTPAVIAPEANTFLDNNQPAPPTDWPTPTGNQVYYLVSGDWVEITITIDDVQHVSTFFFNDYLLGGSPQSARTIADAINLQALYCHADVVFINNEAKLIIEPGGPLASNGNRFSIQQTNASANFIANIGFDTSVKSAPSDEFHAANRYMGSHAMTVTLVIGAESENVRGELQDAATNYFTSILEDRQFTLWGRSFFDNGIPDEAYQVIIKDEGVSLTGEQEVPRPDDPSRKVYLNRLNIPCTFIEYMDRAIQMGAIAQQTDALPDMS